MGPSLPYWRATSCLIPTQSQVAVHAERSIRPHLSGSRRQASSHLHSSNDSTAQKLRLSDGRDLGFGFYGKLDSGTNNVRTVIYSHGMPGSRVDLLEFDEIAKKLGVRLIGIDRPGYGLSTRKPRRALLDYPGDVSQLVDHLGLEKYWLAGTSGGGPHALACARLLPQEQIQGVGIIAGLAPPWISFKSTIGTAQMVRPLVSLFPYSMAKMFWDTSAKFAREADPKLLEESLRKKLFASRKGPDADFVKSDEFIRLIGEIFRDAFQQPDSWRAHGDDLRVLLRSWGFKLADIPHPGIKMYWGSKDVDTPRAMALGMVAQLKDAKYIEYTDRTHMDLVYNEAEDILQRLLST